MRAKFLGSYRNANGNLVFRYEVSGTVTEIENYKVSQGDNYRESDTTGKPLYFTSRYVGDNAKLIITSKGKVVADMSELEQANSLIAQFPGPLGDAIAKATAEKILGGNKAAANAVVNATTQAPMEIPNEDLD